MDGREAHGVLEIVNRKEVRVGGVKSVLGFGDDYVALETSLGKLIIEGEGMKIENLSKDDGLIEITGKVNNAGYSEQKTRQGLLARFTSK